MTASSATEQTEPNRLGFAVKVLGRSGLKSNDARRWQSKPHLRVSLEYLDAIFDYLNETGIRMYRISSDIAPYITHPDLPQFQRQIEDSEEELRLLGAKARRLDLRLSMHPSQYVVLNSPDERIARSAVADFVYHARFLDALGVGPEAKIITHVGGAYGDRSAAMERFVTRYQQLPYTVRCRLVLENDERLFAVPDILAIHDQTGIPLVFDILHHRVNNPANFETDDACRRSLATWPSEQTPKIHYSTQRVAEREITRRVKDKVSSSVQAPRLGQHDDWIDPVDFLEFLDRMGDARFDVMLEAKQKNRALLRLRESIQLAGQAGRIW